MKVKVRHAHGVAVVELALETLAALESATRAALDVQEHQDVRFLAGYPPQTVSGGPETSLEALGVRDGDALRVVVADRPVSRMVRRPVAADGSCLFAAVGKVVYGDVAHAHELRDRAVDEIERDEARWTEAILGKPRAEYVVDMRDPSTWASFTELVVLAELLAVELVAVDVQSLQAIPASGERGAAPDKFGVLLFDGVHWDAVARATAQEGELDTVAASASDITLFPQADRAEIIEECLALAEKARQARQFTDVARFELRCMQCGAGLVGQQGALEHSQSTGHFNFAELT